MWELEPWDRVSTAPLLRNVFYAEYKLPPEATTGVVGLVVFRKVPWFYVYAEVDRLIPEDHLPSGALRDDGLGPHFGVVFSYYRTCGPDLHLRSG